jgi:hypothetical protein
MRHFKKINGTTPLNKKAIASGGENCARIKDSNANQKPIKVLLLHGKLTSSKAYKNWRQLYLLGILQETGRTSSCLFGSNKGAECIMCSVGGLPSLFKCFSVGNPLLQGFATIEDNARLPYFDSR